MSACSHENLRQQVRVVGAHKSSDDFSETVKVLENRQGLQGVVLKVTLVSQTTELFKDFQVDNIVAHTFRQVKLLKRLVSLTEVVLHPL